MENIKDVIAQNLTYLRNKNNMTQLELAEKLNYTDKSVSKWERGETTPPIDVLKSLAELYGISLDTLCSENPNFDTEKESQNKISTNKLLVTFLSVSVVWLLATLLFVSSSMFNMTRPWILFVCAVPISSIVLLVFNCIWGKRLYTFFIVSILIWSILASVYLLLLEYNFWLIFIIGVPLQVAVILWSQFKVNKKQ